MNLLSVLSVESQDLDTKLVSRGPGRLLEVNVDQTKQIQVYYNDYMSSKECDIYIFEYFLYVRAIHAFEAMHELEVQFITNWMYFSLIFIM